MEEHSYLPDANRLSVLAATILLAYALTRFVEFPSREVAFQIPGLYLFFQFNFRTFVFVLVAALAAAGMDWLLSDHPSLTSRGYGEDKVRRVSLVPHWLLPALTAWVIGVPLGNLANGSQWWIVFGMGGVLLILVFVAEYIVVDTSDVRHPPATAGLTALSFALYLILAIAVHSAGWRLYLALPALVAAAGLVSLRTLYLRLGGRWAFAWAVGIALVVGQVAIGLHYLPLSPIRYGLLLLGPLYSLTSLAGSFEEGRGPRRWLGEPVLMIILLWGLAAWFK